MFTEGEVDRCPDCDIAVEPVEDLPTSYEAEQIDPEPPTPPEYEQLSWGYAGRMRGPLILVAVGGIGLFFAPWLREFAPEIRVQSGFEFARSLAWLWAAPVAWFIMLGLVLSRRTVYHMRGARLAVGLLAVMVLATVAMRIAFTPESTGLVPRSYEWGWGLYASGALALVAIAAAPRFGGTLTEPSAGPPPVDRSLH
ncbi:MAG: hypothetical protein JRI23_07780 [Deltaproteobacteria bacterium]|nr:hypothetical protein [Deltaproteobacteria bacterium]MBW2531505.1 hypothetical protein [Deltaproteobacteria bacterium]